VDAPARKGAALSVDKNLRRVTNMRTSPVCGTF